MSKSLKEQWIKDRTEQLRTGPSTALVHLAEDNTIQIDDLMSRKDLARQIAEAEWAGRKGPRNFEELDNNFATAAGLRAAVERAGPYLHEAPGADEFNAMESGPAEEAVYHQLRLDHPPVTESAHDILSSILPDVIGHFLKDNADYGDNHREGLGARAEFVGIHRKVKKLEKALWDGEDMNGEGAEEMLSDLIGQCLITLDLLDREQK